MAIVNRFPNGGSSGSTVEEEYSEIIGSSASIILKVWTNDEDIIFNNRFRVAYVNSVSAYAVSTPTLAVPNYPADGDTFFVKVIYKKDSSTSSYVRLCTSKYKGSSSDNGGYYIQNSDVIVGTVYKVVIHVNGNTVSGQVYDSNGTLLYTNSGWVTSTNYIRCIARTG